MRIGIHSLPAGRWGRIGLVALLGLTLALFTVSPGHADGGHAVVAKKKKCKKKKHKSAAAAKKKKCKRKKPPVTQPAPAPPVSTPKGPVVRAEASWTVTGVTDQADIDLHAFSNGAHTGLRASDSGKDLEIPNLLWEDGFESGHEEILDTTNPSTRGLTFAICSYFYPEADPAEVTYHFVFANGSVLNDTVSMDPGDLIGVDPKEGGLITRPRDEWCPDPET